MIKLKPLLFVFIFAMLYSFSANSLELSVLHIAKNSDKSLTPISQKKATSSNSLPLFTEEITLLTYTSPAQGEQTIKTTHLSFSQDSILGNERETITVMTDAYTGRPLQKTGENNNAVMLSYDAFGRRQSINYGYDGDHKKINTTFDYLSNTHGVQLTTTYPDGVTNTTFFDQLGHKIKQCDNIIDDNTLSPQICQHTTKTMAYDDLGNLKSLQDSKKRIVAYQYDAYHRTTTVTKALSDGGSLVGHTQYNDVANSTTVYSQHGNDKTISVTKINNDFAQEKMEQVAAGTSSHLASTNYNEPNIIKANNHYDNFGQKLDVESDRDNRSSYQTNYNYNTLGEVTNAVNLGNKTLSEPDREMQTTYDLAGNTTKITINPQNSAIIPYQLTYNGEKHLLKKTLFGDVINGQQQQQTENYQYAHGDLQAYTDWAGHSFSFDYENRLGKPVLTVSHTPASQYSIAYDIVREYDKRTGNLSAMYQRDAKNSRHHEVDYTYTVDHKIASITYHNKDGLYAIHRTYDNDTRALKTLTDITGNITTYTYNTDRATASKLFVK